MANIRLIEPPIEEPVILTLQLREGSTEELMVFRAEAYCGTSLSDARFQFPTSFHANSFLIMNQHRVTGYQVQRASDAAIAAGGVE